MFELRKTLYPYLAVYVLIALALWYSKTPLMFDPATGKLREFGVGYSKTIFYYPLVLVFVAMVLFYIHQVVGNSGQVVAS
jgi:hypothetical protein